MTEGFSDLPIEKTLEQVGEEYFDDHLITTKKTILKEEGKEYFICDGLSTIQVRHVMVQCGPWPSDQSAAKEDIAPRVASPPTLYSSL